MKLEELSRHSDTVEQRNDWHGFKCYLLSNKSNEGAKVGTPIYVLGDGKNFRYSTTKERLSIMRDELAERGELEDDEDEDDE